MQSNKHHSQVWEEWLNLEGVPGNWREICVGETGVHCVAIDCGLDVSLLLTDFARDIDT